MAKVSHFNVLGQIVDVKDATVDSKIEVVENDYKEADKTIRNALPISSNSRVLTVGKTGAQFHTINDALARAIALKVSLSNPVVILVYTGVYNEQILLNNVHGLSILGIGDVTIQSNGSYPDCTIHCQGDVTFWGLTIINNNSSTYAVHIDPLDTLVSGTISFIDCYIKGGTNAVGYGSGNYTGLILDHCKLEGVTAPLYAHNSSYAGRSGQWLIVNNCTFVDNASHMTMILDDAGYTNGGKVSQMQCLFKNNVSTYQGFAQMTFRKATGLPSTFTSHIPVDDSNIICGVKCSGNTNIVGMDWNRGVYNISTYCAMPSNKSSDGVYRVSIPIEVYYANYYTTLNSVVIPGIGDVTSTFSIDSQSNEHFIHLVTNNDNVAGRSVSVSISMVCR